MHKIDLKDKRILTALDEDGRDSLSGIASKVGLSKQVVDYRIRNLLEKGILKNFTLTVDLTKLGYSTFGVYLRLRNISEAREKEIISHLVSHPFTRWVVVCEGKWDLAFAMSAKNILDFNNRIEEIMAFIGNNLESYETNIIFSIQPFYIDLIGKKEQFAAKPIRNEFATEPADTKLDSLDIRIIQHLEQNARASLVEIASNLKTSPDVVRYRIRNLVARKIIVEFKARISFKTLGYNWYQLLIDMNRPPETQQKKFIEIIRSIPNITYMTRCMGKWDFELHIHSESNEAYRKILMKVRDEMAELIVSYDTLIIFEKYKSTTFPEGVVDELLKIAREAEKTQKNLKQAKG
ncbi:Lrp/AsnC family transcriptional regulator [Candidatus Woesearchaeota archaeon]|nr:Lrp/AsnC family transcriptional regulator [Candidatus Woesearchaeota archaeon]